MTLAALLGSEVMPRTPSSWTSAAVESIETLENR
jgi:hypothetical protein